MKWFLFRLVMAAVGLAIFYWAFDQFRPFLQSFQHVADVLGR